MLYHLIIPSDFDHSSRLLISSIFFSYWARTTWEREASLKIDLLLCFVHEIQILTYRNIPCFTKLLYLVIWWDMVTWMNVELGQTEYSYSLFFSRCWYPWEITKILPVPIWIGPWGLSLISDLFLDTTWWIMSVLDSLLAYQEPRLSFIGLEAHHCCFVSFSTWPNNDSLVQHQFDYLI